MNADGWGVGLHVATQPTPVRWRSTRPMWSDASFASVAPLLTAGSVLAAVRSATTGMPIEESATAPFTDGHWLLSHNGRVDRSVLPVTLHAESTCDAALLAAHIFATGPEQVADTIQQVARLDPDAFLTVLLAAPDRLMGVTWGDTLCYLVEPDGTVVASERSDDDPRWVDVPDHHLIDVTPSGVTLTDLDAL
jgi:glutamine amidotransferase